MDDKGRTLVVFLSMHRCGSSVTASTLRSLGMSLGPFSLMDAAPSNPHGHFEAIPFYLLNRKVQELALGFPDDLPASPDVLERFCKAQGVWPEGLRIPDELLEEGRSLVQTLINSGEVSGFKDPRTVLTWPFWTRVLEHFPDLRVVPVSLLRSPHEIAMSLVTRHNGWCGYWACLDVIAVHLRRQQAILANWPEPPPGLRFGDPSYWESLAEVSRRCGLTWDRNKAIDVFDHACVHHVPASVDHEAQEVFAALLRQPAPERFADANDHQLRKDARSLEELQVKQWQSVARELSEAKERAQQADTRAEHLGRQLREVEGLLVDTRAKLLAVQETLIDKQAQMIEACRDNEALRTRVHRFESHPLLNAALRARRGVRKMIPHFARETTNRS